VNENLERGNEEKGQPNLVLYFMYVQNCMRAFIFGWVKMEEEAADFYLDDYFCAGIAGHWGLGNGMKAQRRKKKIIQSGHELDCWIGSSSSRLKAQIWEIKGKCVRKGEGKAGWQFCLMEAADNFVSGWTTAIVFVNCFVMKEKLTKCGKYILEESKREICGAHWRTFWAKPPSQIQNSHTGNGPMPCRRPFPGNASSLLPVVDVDKYTKEWWACGECRLCLCPAVHFPHLLRLD